MKFSRIIQLIFTAVTLSALVFPSAVFADQTLVTDPNFINPNVNPDSDIYVEVARASTALGSYLHAPTSYIRLSFKEPPPAGESHYFRISYCSSGPYCASNSRDIISINARAYAGASGEDQTGGFRQIPGPAAGVNHALPGGVTKSIVNGRYNYLLSVNHVKSTGLTVNETAIPFRIRAVAHNNNNGLYEPRAGFGRSTNPNLPFAIQNRTQNVSGATHRDNMRVGFRIPCRNTDGTLFDANSFLLKWQDADAKTDATPVNTDIRWRIHWYRNGVRRAIISSENQHEKEDWFWGAGTAGHQNYLGGDGDERDEVIDTSEINFQPGDEIEWVWESVRANNGVQLYMPFDDSSLFDNCEEVSYNHRAEFTTASSGTYPPGGTVRPGVTYTVGVEGWNIGVNNGDNSTMVVENTNRNIVSNISSTPITPIAYRRTGFGFHNFYASHIDAENVNAGINGNCSEDDVDRNLACWVWLTQNLPRNQARASASFSFRISDSANDGDQACFDLHIKPRTILGGAYSPSDLCFTVRLPRKPIIEVSGNDAHAGATLSSNGESCDFSSSTAPGASSSIRSNTASNPTQGSKGQYAVSATGIVSNGFASDNGQVGGRGLVFNNDSVSLPGGSYTPICRSDEAGPLPALADRDGSYTSLGPTQWDAMTADSLANDDTKQKVFHLVPGGTGNGTLTIERSGVGNPFFVGQGVRKKIIVHGNVRIHNPIEYFPTYNNRSQIPSFALIATGNIEIPGWMRRLDGLYISNAKIDTCNNPSGYSNCNFSLDINGAVVANQIEFGRTSGNVGGDPAERIRFLPELYLAPPPDDNGTVKIIRNSHLDLPPVF